MAKSQRNHTQNPFGLKKWIEVEIKSTKVAETTKEPFVVRNKLLIKKSDISRVAGHPVCDDEALLALNDGANFHVCMPYEQLRDIVVNG